MSADFEAMWRELAPIGRSATSGGYFRQPYESAELELRAWFRDQSRERGLEIREDVFGNVYAWWLASADRPAVMTGSHLDSVLDGGAFDGPLGVVSAFAAVDRLRERGFTPARPIAIGAFVEEEGSRFGLACLGSRLASGSMDWTAARELRDRDGVFLPDAMHRAGVGFQEPSATSEEIGNEFRHRVGCFVELHVEQGRHLVDRNAPIAAASGIWPHGRYRFEFTGEANHAGTTRMEDRRDPMLTYAMTVLSSNKQARLSGQRATFGRVSVRPNGTNAIPSAVTAWLDARCETDEALADLVATIERQASDRAERDGTAVHLTAESVSGTVTFDADLTARIVEGRDWPVIPTQAGHDAGILSAAGIPTAMLFVRNPTGISHSPAEHADIADCLAGVEALADTLQRLAS